MHVHCKITGNRSDGGKNHTLFLDRGFDVLPGQFVMAWVSGESEKPFSLSYENAITVKDLGWYSRRLLDLAPGDSIWIRGPYGTSFPVGEGAVLLGGGVGIAALLILAKRAKSPVILLGGRTAEDILFLEEFKGAGTVRVATEDGSLGRKGLITDLLPQEGRYYCVCGPDKMMAALKPLLPPERSFYSLERYMKCAIGLCGQCTCNGYRVCTDGPVFDGVTAQEMTDIGRRKRKKSGGWEYS
ncbi:MAG: dihydroorotate dehydrogenase electron transfer subunit [Candidatus Tectomicrobia bacterium]|nr:dihydroorotate dehydrogenase electron transfer subunit [Candidatus Tectomicrobia bacterium]